MHLGSSVASLFKGLRLPRPNLTILSRASVCPNFLAVPLLSLAMSDSFELRLKFLQQLKTLNASQPSIEKLVGFCIKHGAQCGEDLWECVLEQTQQVGRYDPELTFRAL